MNFLKDYNNQKNIRFKSFEFALLEANRRNHKTLVETGVARGKKKFMAFSKLSEKGLPCRLDILYTPKEEYNFAKLYFTGSKEHNVKMRNKALKLNYTLNEHGLYNIMSPHII